MTDMVRSEKEALVEAREQAFIERIRGVDFDDHSSETIYLAECGHCKQVLIYQLGEGWPTICPACQKELILPTPERICSCCGRRIA